MPPCRLWQAMSSPPMSALEARAVENPLYKATRRACINTASRSVTVAPNIPMTTQQAKPAVKQRVKVGVIFVHGIGEQKRFQHLESEVRKIVDAVIDIFGKPHRRSVTVRLDSGDNDAFHGEQMSWASGSQAPLHIHVETPTASVDVALHEVWWADINEELTLWKQVRFWLWGTALPGIATNNQPYLPGATAHTRLPAQAGELTAWMRFRLLFVSILFVIAGVSIGTLNFILKRLRFDPVLTTATLVNFLSAIKIYLQPERSGGSPMDGPDEPPRFAIRRRMIRTIVDVATAGYDRWYIFAHSLGTVVAWNGLMEVDHTLPNYLDEKRWGKILAQSMNGQRAGDVDVMVPSRPNWLTDRDTVDRARLFEKFRGFLSYGSPLDRFSVLWAGAVPINLDEQVFAAGTEWINVYDPTDPVANWLVNYNPADSAPLPGRTVLTPVNFPCRASPFLLLSHIRYFRRRRWIAKYFVGEDEFALVRLAARWLVQGGSLHEQLQGAPRGCSTFWMPRRVPPARLRSGETILGCLRRWSRFAQWVAVAVLLTYATDRALFYFAGNAAHWIYLSLLLAAAVVIAVWLVECLLEWIWLGIKILFTR